MRDAEAMRIKLEAAKAEWKAEKHALQTRIAELEADLKGAMSSLAEAKPKGKAKAKK